MKSNTKSSITLPPSELKLVEELMKTFKSKTKVEIIRRGLHLLKDSVDREALRVAYQNASRLTRDEALEIDDLADEGLHS
jgi:hypothetical protein